MTNKDVLRQLRYIFNFGDSEMIDIFGLADVIVSRSQISDWLKKEEDPESKEIVDEDLAVFLNGFINLKRGKREGVKVVPEKKLTNNIILRKLKIALDFKDNEMIDIFDLADMRVSKHEISAFFRNPKQRQYRLCLDQFLRNFLFGLQLKFRPK